MIYQFLTVILIASSLLLQTVVTSKKTPAAVAKALTNSTSSPPKQTSYFYRDPQGPGTYEFSYHIEDKAAGNIQFREEKRYPNGTITGTYGYLRPDKKMTIIHYVADKNGYKEKRETTEYPPSSTTTTTTSTTTDGDILDPTLLDIINGKIPLTINKNTSQLGFEVVHEFIPSDLPIEPFQLPELPYQPFDGY